MKLKTRMACRVSRKREEGEVFPAHRGRCVKLLQGIIIGFASIASVAADEAQPAGGNAVNMTQTSGTSLRNLSLEELMNIKVQTESTVSRADERTDQAPGSVYVYTREMIEERGYHSLGELLSTRPGFHGISQGPPICGGCPGPRFERQ